MNYLSILSIFLYITCTYSQNCLNLSPNNDPTQKCQQSRSFFRASTPELSISDPCLCCDADTGDYPDACGINETYNSIEGKIECGDNYDCCMCNEINCNLCKVVSCNGDESCMGVKPININGNIINNGASLNCNGDVSCYNTIINGEYINNILCGGDWSCAKSKMYLNILNNNNNVPELLLNFNGDKSCYDCEINANNVISIAISGDNALENSILNIICKSISYDNGCSIDISGDNSAQGNLRMGNMEYDAKWNIINASKLLINGNDGAKNTNFTIKFIPIGGKITINGNSGAENSLWNINNAESLIINGINGCKNSTFNINFIQYGGDVGIGLPYSASNVKWTFNNVGLFACNDDHGCSNSFFKLNFVENGNNKIKFNGINNAINTVAILDKISGLACHQTSACENTEFNVTCSTLENGCDIECDGYQSCYKSKWNIDSVNKITCNGDESCNYVNWDISCMNNTEGCEISCYHACSFSNYSIVNTNGITCGDAILTSNLNYIGSCESSTFNLINNIGGSIMCKGNRACYSSTFILMENIDSVTCDGQYSCYDTSINAICNDINNGCPLYCDGINSCSVSIKQNINKMITLHYTNNIVCKNGCHNRIFNIIPAKETSDFTILCQSCKESIFNIVDDNNELYIKTIKCQNKYVCENTKFVLSPMKNININKIKCSGYMSCNQLNVEINIGNINDKIILNNFKCSTKDSCIDTVVLIKLNNTLLNATQLFDKINNNTLDISIFCSKNEYCAGASINNIIPFSSINQQLTIEENQSTHKKIENMRHTLYYAVIISIAFIFISFIIVMGIMISEKNKSKTMEIEMVNNFFKNNTKNKDNKKNDIKKIDIKNIINKNFSIDDDIEIIEDGNQVVTHETI